MAEYAVMPKADYLDACNAVREKTGGTAAIKSGDMGTLIRGIESGASLDTCTVKFVGMDQFLDAVIYTAVVGGALVPKVDVGQATHDFTLTDVLCGSAVALVSGVFHLAYSISGDSEYLGGANMGFGFRAPATAGAEVTITVWEDF